MYLSVEQVTCGYGATPVLVNFSIQVAHGDFLVVVGPNGSGKSTLIKAISRLLPLRTGRIFLGGQSLTRYGQSAFAREVAVVTQETQVEFDFTVAEVVAMGRLPYLQRFRSEGERDREAVEAALNATNTAHLVDRSVLGLSGGEKQRVMVARALAQEPRLLILDEPTAHLDIAHQVELLDLIRRLNVERGLTVIAVLHDLNLAAQYANRVLMLKDGERYAEGDPAATITEANVLAVYGTRVRVMTHPDEARPHVLLLSGSRNTDQST